ncbi:hypothetical protein PENTCL1PPCAC_24759, partial [Pristionchus entomophagus]
YNFSVMKVAPVEDSQSKNPSGKETGKCKLTGYAKMVNVILGVSLFIALDLTFITTVIADRRNTIDETTKTTIINVFLNCMLAMIPIMVILFCVAFVLHCLIAWDKYDENISNRGAVDLSEKPYSLPEIIV